MGIKLSFDPFSCSSTCPLMTPSGHGRWHNAQHISTGNDIGSAAKCRSLGESDRTRMSTWHSADIDFHSEARLLLGGKSGHP
jgi:hypothetical protein